MYPLRDLIKKYGIENFDKWDKNEIRPFNFEDICNAIKKVKKSVDENEVHRYIEWNEKFGVHS